MTAPLDSNATSGPKANRRALEETLYHFETAWQSGECPSIEDFLADDFIAENLAEKFDRIELLTELVRFDMSRRIHAGEDANVESYLTRFPDLDAAATVELLTCEFRARSTTTSANVAEESRECAEESASESVSTPPSIDEFVQRFPSFRAELTERLNKCDDQRKRLRMNCPHCRNPIVIIVEEGETDAKCSVCGSSFELDTRVEVSWSPQRLPKLGKFQLLEVVGRGAFGSVYRARDTDLQRIVAAKVPRSGQFSSQEDEDRFVREARNVAQLNHPGIVPVYEVGRDDGLPYIIAEFVKGVPLSELLQSRRLRFEESADIIASVAEALQHAHGRGVVHRDLKPANIMLDRMGGIEREMSITGAATDSTRNQTIRNQTIRTCGRARLMDFGLARRDNGEITVTMEGQLLGTPAYMSPEQARGATREIDERSDVYSLGVMLYEMLTGELPFRGSSRMVLQQVIHDDPTNPRKFVSQVPSDLETICLKCMEKDRAKRYQSAGELNAELCRYLNGQPILARPISSIDRAVRWCRSNKLVATLTAALLFSLVAGLFGVATQWQRAEQNATSAAEEAQRANVAADQAQQAAEREALAAKAERTERQKAEQAEILAAKSAAQAKLKAEAAKEVSSFLVGLFQGADRLGIRGYRFGPPPDQTADPTARQLLDRGAKLIETELKDKPAIRAAIQLSLAETYISLGVLGQGEELATKALAIRRELHQDTPNEDTANVLATLGMIRYIQGNYEAAVPLFRESVEMMDTLYGETDPRGANHKLFFAFIVLESNITGAEVDEAEKLIQQVVAIRQAEENPPIHDLAHALIGKAIILRVRGKTMPALAALAQANAVLSKSPNRASYVNTAFKAVQATINWDAGRVEVAKKQAYDVIEEAQKTLGSYHPVVTQVRTDQAVRMFGAGARKEGVAMLREGVVACRIAYGRQPRTARSLYRLGTQLMKWKKNSEEAEDLLRESVEIYKEVLGDDNIRTRRAIKEHARALTLLHREQEATEQSRQIQN